MSGNMLQFDIAQYENIRKLIRKNPDFARTYLRMWLDIANALADTSTARLIQDTSDQIGISTTDVISGIVQGCLNEQFINEGLAPIMGKELLPIGILTLKATTFEGEELYFDWRRWYRMERKAVINQETIAKVIGNIMKYARFLDFDKLSEALESNQLICFKAMADEQVKLLPYYPALRYQRETFGEFHTGKFMPEINAGFFDCGTIATDETHCLACGRKDLTKSKDEKHIYCKACNAGYKPKGEIEK